MAELVVGQDRPKLDVHVDEYRWKNTTPPRIS